MILTITNPQGPSHSTPFELNSIILERLKFVIAGVEQRWVHVQNAFDSQTSHSCLHASRGNNNAYSRMYANTHTHPVGSQGPIEWQPIRAFNDDMDSICTHTNMGTYMEMGRRHHTRGQWNVMKNIPLPIYWIICFHRSAPHSRTPNPEPRAKRYDSASMILYCITSIMAMVAVDDDDHSRHTILHAIVHVENWTNSKIYQTNIVLHVIQAADMGIYVGSPFRTISIPIGFDSSIYLDSCSSVLCTYTNRPKFGIGPTHLQ